MEKVTSNIVLNLEELEEITVPSTVDTLIGIGIAIGITAGVIVALT